LYNKGVWYIEYIVETYISCCAGVVRTLYKRGCLQRCYFTETRPYNQGARLTACELLCDAIPSTMLCDDMVAAAMSHHGIDAVVTGADRSLLRPISAR